MRHAYSVALPNLRARFRAAAGLLLVVAALWLVLTPAQAFAGGGGGGGGGGEKQNCQGNGVIERIVPCITRAIEKSTTKLTNSLSIYLRPAVATLIVLVIIIYGVRAMTPEGNVQRTAIPFAFKIGIVLLFTANFGGFIPAVHGGMYDLVDLVAGTLDTGDSSGQCESGGGSGSGGSSHQSDKVWKAMDCVLGKLYGFTGQKGNGALIASIFGLMAGFLFSGSFGVIAFFGILGVLWSVFMFVARAVFAFLNGFMLASFMVIISPLFIPLILLQVTSQYFMSWLKVFISAFILPVVIVGYACFALSIYQEVLFKKDSAKAVRKVTDKQFSESITSMRPECLGTLANDVNLRGWEGKDSKGGDLNKSLKSHNVQEPVNPLQSGSQAQCMKVPNIDIHNLPDGFKNKQDFFRRIFTDAGALLILAWVLSAVVPVLIDLVQVMGSGAAATLMGPVSSLEKKLAAASENMQQQAQQAMMNPNGSGVSGAEFIRRIPQALMDATKGAVKGIE